jgi:uracil-DNA glycosylase family 4
VDAHQDELSNPFGMDEDCENCPALCETRTSIAHGYGPVDADFAFVGERPGPGADRSGIPFAGDADERRVYDVLSRVDLCDDPNAEEPEPENAFLTYLTRCRHPDRGPTDDEIRNCDPFLTAEIRMINPEILVPIGDRTLREIATEYTTRPAEEFSIAEHNGEAIRGRGFEILPMVDPTEGSDEQVETFVEALSDTLGRDYRQTKGRRSR